ncbi:competence/damage-inducible protein A [Coralliovum pocilloporae]|uniref:competence/damage-inducible protein A n=1 Tax=Coralliovum pocilloporae TaxID=3066369 RepID=UPI00330702D2
MSNPASESAELDLSSPVTAAVLVIGDEILSGRTKDTNTGFIAEYLTALGVDLKEVRVVADEIDAIVSAVNALRSAYTYVFTTGGIGPTHDDITADAMAVAFGVDLPHDPRAVAILEARYEPGDLNEARLRMARIPEGADLIHNPVSGAPGFRIGNVHVMAGVPAVMHAMMDEIAPTLETGRKMLSRSVEAGVGEGWIGGELGALQKQHPAVSMGSYPYFDGEKFATQIVIRSRDEDALETAEQAVETMVASIRARIEMEKQT